VSERRPSDRPILAPLYSPLDLPDALAAGRNRPELQIRFGLEGRPCVRLDATCAEDEQRLLEWLRATPIHERIGAMLDLLDDLLEAA
jgi:hypothetical protein